MPQQPVWASLPAELRQLVASVAARELYRLDVSRAFDLEELAGLLPWLRLVASLSAVSRSLRAALPGLGWDNIVLMSSYTMLDKRASRSLNRCACEQLVPCSPHACSAVPW